MKARILFSLCILFSTFSFADEFLAAENLAEKGIIVDQSTSADYRIGSYLSRQEALGIVLKMINAPLEENYTCRDYFSDVRESWVCRSVEIAADRTIVSRENQRFRPQDTLTLAESLGILIKGLGIPLSNSSLNSIGAQIPDWQKRVLITLDEQKIGSVSLKMATFDGFSLNQRVTRGDFFEIVQLFLVYQNADPVAHCTTYNDGCNECSVMEDGGAACTKRACFWEGIPQCHTCEDGYSLKGARCIKNVSNTCVSEGGYAGGGHVMGPENMADLQCCSGLTRAERADGTTFADAGYTCIRQGDNVCDSEFENSLNSSDCRTFDPAICASYFDGCNSCSQTENGAVCTMMYCAVPAQAYCTSYVSYAPKSQEKDGAFLASVTKETELYAQSFKCSSSADCRSLEIGAKACGGPLSYLPYSTISIDQKLLQTKADYLAQAYRDFNTRYDIVSDCMMQMPPTVECINNRCQ